MIPVFIVESTGRVKLRILNLRKSSFWILKPPDSAIRRCFLLEQYLTVVSFASAYFNEEVSVATVKRDWLTASAWLRNEIQATPR